MPRRVQKLGGNYNVLRPSKIATARVAARSENCEAEAESQLKTSASAVDVGEGYRLLNEGEMLSKGDEYYGVFSNSWFPVTFQVFGIPQSDDLKYRRRISTPVDEAEVWSPKKGDVVVCVKNLYQLGEKPLKEGQIFKVANLTIIFGHVCLRLQEYPGDEIRFGCFSLQRFRRTTPHELEIYNLQQI